MQQKPSTNLARFEQQSSKNQAAIQQDSNGNPARIKQYTILIKYQFRIQIVPFLPCVKHDRLRSMSILLSNISAMEFWRYAAHARRMPPASAWRVLNKPLGRPSCGEVASLAEGGFPFLSKPVHLLVESKIARCRCCGVRCHVAPSDFFWRHVVRLAKGIYVVPPATCFFELSSALPLPNAVETGFELCGQYACAIGGFDKLAKRPPLADVDDLRRAFERLGSTRGVGAARQAARFVRNGSRSPMETVTVVLLCLPVKLGGYGLPFPLMNAAVTISAKDRAFVKKSYYECDLYWPEAKFAIEYDSNLHHTGATRIAEDASRRTDLAYLGIEVATLTQQQVCDLREMDRVARLLAKRLGRRLRMERLNPSGVQDSLRNLLLDTRYTNITKRIMDKNGAGGCENDDLRGESDL